jgi:2OG-Fe(II) oxygenase superfamily
MVKQDVSDSVGSEYWSVRLKHLLEVIEPLGTYASVGAIPSFAFPLPMVTVQGVGKLAFPLMDVAIEPLKAVSARAPFGKGTETVQDDTVRKAWQMDASQVSLGGGKAWDKALQSIVNKACHDLGFSMRRIQELGIHATLYKLLLYETGGHFTPHQDTEKEAGMFGTLVIQLPSRFMGGELSVWHNGETKKFDLADQCEEQFKRIAFYTDCEHQLHPITSGVRICLVFNLVATTPTQIGDVEGQKPEGLTPKAATGTIQTDAKRIFMPSHDVNIETLCQLQSIAADWTTSKNCASKLGYRLGHQYTPRSFAFSSLKGRDSILVQTLMAAKSLEGRPLFKVHLLLMERYIKQYIDMGGPEIEKDEVRARIVLGENGEVYKADYGWGQPNDMNVDDEESDGSVDLTKGDTENDDDDNKGQGKDNTAKNTKVGNWNMFLSKDGWMKQGEWIEEAKNLKRAYDEAMKDEDDKGGDNEEEEDEEEEEEEEEDSDDDMSKYDDDGNPLRSEHKMFRGVNKQHVEPHQGNCAGSVEQWYYAAAIVLSVAKD